MLLENKLAFLDAKVQVLEKGENATFQMVLAMKKENSQNQNLSKFLFLCLEAKSCVNELKHISIYIIYLLTYLHSWFQFIIFLLHKMDLPSF